MVACKFSAHMQVLVKLPAGSGPLAKLGSAGCNRCCVAYTRTTEVAGQSAFRYHESPTRSTHSKLILPTLCSGDPAGPMAQPTAEEAWAGLTDVERTALHALVLRVREGGRKSLVTNEVFYTDEPGALAVSRCVPKEQQEAIIAHARAWGDGSGWFVTIRTAEIDRQIKAAMSEHGIRQFAIIGAGLDTRAWRLQWPDGTCLFEVDTPTSQAFKARALHGCEPACSRAELGLDLKDSSKLGPMLHDAGFDENAQTFWLMEGFIGYVTKEVGAALLSLLHSLCAPGSLLLMTAPPTAEHRDSVAVKGIKLHHATFEPPTDTLARAKSCRWEGRVIMAQELRQRYGLEQQTDVQEMLLLNKTSS